MSGSKMKILKIVFLKDIRRVRVAADTFTVHELAHVIHAQHSLQKNQYLLQYIDENNVEKIIGTDKELRTAIASASNSGPLKIYIILAPGVKVPIRTKTTQGNKSQRQQSRKRNENNYNNRNNHNHHQSNRQQQQQQQQHLQKQQSLSRKMNPTTEFNGGNMNLGGFGMNNFDLTSNNDLAYLNKELNDACRNTDDLDKIQMLISKGASVNSNNGHPFYHSPLHQAAFHNRRAVAELLLRNDAPLYAVGNGGRPCDVARTQGHADMAYLLDNPPLQITHSSERGYWTTYHNLDISQGDAEMIPASECSNVEKLKRIAEHKGMSAIATGSFPFAAFKKLDFQLRPEHCTAPQQYFNRIYIYTPPPLPASIDGLNMALIRLCYEGFSDIQRIKELLKRGASLSCRGGPPYNFTPLHQAACFGHLELAKLLIDLGAPVLSNSSAGTPYQVATMKGHHAVAALLAGSGSNNNMKQRSNQYAHRSEAYAPSTEFTRNKKNLGNHNYEQKKNINKPEQPFLLQNDKILIHQSTKNHAPLVKRDNPAVQPEAEMVTAPKPSGLAKQQDVDIAVAAEAGRKEDVNIEESRSVDNLVHILGALEVSAPTAVCSTEPLPSYDITDTGAKSTSSTATVFSQSLDPSHLKVNPNLCDNDNPNNQVSNNYLVMNHKAMIGSSGPNSQSAATAGRAPGPRPVGPTSRSPKNYQPSADWYSPMTPTGHVSGFGRDVCFGMGSEVPSGKDWNTPGKNMWSAPGYQQTPPMKNPSNSIGSPIYDLKPSYGSEMMYNDTPTDIYKTVPANNPGLYETFTNDATIYGNSTKLYDKSMSNDSLYYSEFSTYRQSPDVTR